MGFELPEARRERPAIRGSYDARCLAGTAAAVWRSCDGRTTPAELARSS